MFPDRIERTVELAKPPDVVWSALTTAHGLAAWFGSEAAIDLRPGGIATLRWPDGSARELQIERVEPPRLFAFTWSVEGLPDDDPRRTLVEFNLEPSSSGSQLRVVETGFAQLPPPHDQVEYDAHSEGWTRELAELVEYVDQ